MNLPASPPEQAPAADDAEVAASIGLAMLPGVGPRTIRRWLDQVGSAAGVWRQVPALVAGRARADEVVAGWHTAAPDAVLAQARARGMTVVPCTSPAYASRLRAIPDPPPVLFIRGEVGEGPAVAIVGSRRATPYGRTVSGRLAAELAEAGVCVVSGMARGIDGAAHLAALDAGGRTVAVLGCGVDVIYPREHRRLAERISAAGALVSEFAPGVPPLPGHFPRRNRLISGLAMGVVVIEGTHDSGAMVTVDYALDQGREVFAVPGSIFSSKSRAPHNLLRQGARIVESAADVLEELGLASAPPLVTGDAAAGGLTPPADPHRDEQRLLALLEGGTRSLDELVEETGLPASRLAALVGMLEVRGLVQVYPGQMVMRVPRRE
jgi:DNA processing protein